MGQLVSKCVIVQIFFRFCVNGYLVEIVTLPLSDSRDIHHLASSSKDNSHVWTKCQITPKMSLVWLCSWDEGWSSHPFLQLCIKRLYTTPCYDFSQISHLRIFLQRWVVAVVPFHCFPIPVFTPDTSFHPLADLNFTDDLFNDFRRFVLLQSSPLVRVPYP